jgi:hypothetical protein
MATAAKKRTPNKSFAANPPKSRYKAPATKTNPKRRKSSASKTMHSRSRRRKNYQRNPSISGNAAIMAIGGAFVLLGFNELVARFAPSVSQTIRIVGKAAAGWAVGRYGRKYLGSWATVVQGALWLTAASEALQVWVVPQLPAGWITNGQPPVVSQQQIQNPNTGQLGTRYNLADGNSIDVYEGNSQMAY